MITEMGKRKYALKQRAAQQQHTRERIVDAAMTLHEALGPAETTISAIADKAGVQRLTVYRHFPDDAALFGACSSKWLGLHPPPDVSTITDKDPVRRMRAVLHALYSYYRDTQKMWTSVYRDAGKVAALAGPIAAFDGYLAGIKTELMAGRPARKSKRAAATLGHALQFTTWRSLAAQRLGDGAMADLVCAWMCAATYGCAAKDSKPQSPVT